MSEAMDKQSVLHLFEEARRLRDSICRERDERFGFYFAAMKKGDFRTPPPDDFLQRFENRTHFGDFYENKILTAEKAVRDGRPSRTTLLRYVSNIETKYLLSIAALSEEIDAHPERVRPGEEAIAARIREDLGHAAQNARQLAAALRELSPARGGGSAGRGRR